MLSVIKARAFRYFIHAKRYHKSAFRYPKYAYCYIKRIYIAYFHIVSQPTINTIYLKSQQVYYNPMLFFLNII